MEDDSNKSGKYPPVVGSDRKAVKLVASGLVLVSLASFTAGTIMVRDVRWAVCATLFLLGGAMGFAAVIHLWRK